MVELVRRYSKIPPLVKLGQFAPEPRGQTTHRIHDARKRLGSARVQQLVADYEAGLPSTELMTKYDLGKGTVLNLLRSQGVQLRGHGLREGDLPTAIQLYQEGWSLKRLGERFGCDAETVRKELKKAGVSPRPRNGWAT